MTRDRFLAMCVPGRLEDGSDTSWFVHDTAAPAHDVTRSVECDNMSHALREARRLNAENEVRHWRGILRLHGTAFDSRRYKVFPAGTDDYERGDIGLVTQVGGGWEAFGLDGKALHLPVQKFASMNDALEAVVVAALKQASKTREEKADLPAAAS